jgi:hypothetical protein
MATKKDDDFVLDAKPGCFPITFHALKRLWERWPETVLTPGNLSMTIMVPLNAQLLGYDPRTSARYLEVPGTPMVALVEQDIVTTFLTRDACRYKLMLRGYWFGDQDGPVAA